MERNIPLSFPMATEPPPPLPDLAMPVPGEDPEPKLLDQYPYAIFPPRKSGPWDEVEIDRELKDTTIAEHGGYGEQPAPWTHKMRRYRGMVQRRGSALLAQAITHRVALVFAGRHGLKDYIHTDTLCSVEVVRGRPVIAGVLGASRVVVRRDREFEKKWRVYRLPNGLYAGFYFPGIEKREGP